MRGACLSSRGSRLAPVGRCRAVGVMLGGAVLGGADARW